MDQAGQSQPPAKPGALRGDLRRPVGVFLIAFGVVKILELADWSRLHQDAGAMFALGSGAVTGLLIGAKTIELLLTVAAVLSMVRHNGTLLLGALSGWTAEFALLAVLAAVHGDLARLIEHGLFCVAFGGLLTMTYTLGPRHVTTSGPRFDTQEIALDAPAEPRPDPAPALGERAVSPPKDRPVAPREHAMTRPEPLPSGERRSPAASDRTRQDLPVQKKDATRQDLPVQKKDATRQDPHVRGGDATRQDLPVRRKAPPDDPETEPVR